MAGAVPGVHPSDQEWQSAPVREMPEAWKGRNNTFPIQLSVADHVKCHCKSYYVLKGYTKVWRCNHRVMITVKQQFLLLPQPTSKCRLTGYLISETGTMDPGAMS